MTTIETVCTNPGNIQPISTSNESEPNRFSSLTDRSISIKDFAYSSDNPMHYGVYEEFDEDDSKDNPIDELEDKNIVFTFKKDNESGKLKPTNEYIRPKDTKESSITASATGSEEENLTHAVALYPFEPENENELRLTTDQIIIISYEYGDGWLVAYDPFTGETGLVPSGYVQIVGRDVEFAEEVLDEEEIAQATRYLPGVLNVEQQDQEDEDQSKSVLKKEPKAPDTHQKDDSDISVSLSHLKL
ncbi:hypothetical protein FOA43_002189 [Brettanomyces nanus]|uniref:SH3 domain-containing protein n=1 Tax=Eeniella nana TaxID=13502 RepID=A0A875S1Q7_EENNA|nr:uncharacterized protein FOA43_002189 [Brettanomyces nanus]QPG74853.1 hypothetical protein FOA43_002189 [Brettanomyces nanus]